MWTLPNDKHVNRLVARVELLSASLHSLAEKTTDQHLFCMETANTPLFMHENRGNGQLIRRGEDCPLFFGHLLRNPQ